MSGAERLAFTISEPELQILVNIFNGKLELTYPFTNLPLYSCMPDGGNYLLRTKFRKESFTSIEEDPILDGPSYFDILECLVSSGLLGFTNLDDFKKKLAGYSSCSRVLYVLDTNMLYRRFATNTRLVDPINYVIVSTVRDEITSMHNYRYSQEQINQMKHKAKFEIRLLDELTNRRVMKSRKAFRFANKELKALSSAKSVEAEGRFNGQAEEGDRIIAKTASRLSREENLPVVLLTADTTMVDICVAEGVDCFLFELPKEIPEEIRCSGSQLITFIADLAEILGVIKANSAILYGEFKGKRDTDDLKAIFLDRKTGERLRVDLEVCRKLVGLGLEG